MNSQEDKPRLKWVIKFKKEYVNLLTDLKDTPIFTEKYPVFKMQLAEEILSSKVNHYFHIKQEEASTEIKDPTGKTVPYDSCLFILGISKELGIIKLLFFPQSEGRLVLVGLDEVWIKVLEKIEESQRLTVLTNVVASFVTKKDVWNQIFLVY